MNETTFDPSRFLQAQEMVYADVLEELRAGRKRSHWMWFIFPQLAVLGQSSTARFYGLAGRIQPVDATIWLNISAGVWKPRVFLGLSFNCLANALSLACE